MFLPGKEDPAIMYVTFSDFLIDLLIANFSFTATETKRDCKLVQTGIYEFPQEFSKDLRLRRISKIHRIIA